MRTKLRDKQLRSFGAVASEGIADKRGRGAAERVLKARLLLLAVVRADGRRRGR